MLTILVRYEDDRGPSATIASPDVLRNADLPALASRLLRMLPAVERVQIFDGERPVADTASRGQGEVSRGSCRSSG
ncbi:hypothetical protein ThrDRAFT_04182 [Frankia casuarinae]|jgi:hypothetical protein|nr:hypothetical protein [Frankia casuarinae]EYT90192.1 hypothetical protein ThrDRAFT_04182 [Frankia casuarinae]